MSEINPNDNNFVDFTTEITTNTVEEEITKSIIEDPTAFANHLKEAEIILTRNRDLFKEYKSKWDELNETLIRNLSNIINEI